MRGTQTRSRANPVGKLCLGLRTVPLGSDLKEKPSGGLAEGSPAAVCVEEPWTWVYCGPPPWASVSPAVKEGLHQVFPGR